MEKWVVHKRRYGSWEQWSQVGRETIGWFSALGVVRTDVGVPDGPLKVEVYDSHSLVVAGNVYRFSRPLPMELADKGSEVLR